MTRAICPRLPFAGSLAAVLKNDQRAADHGSQVGHEHVIAAHLDGEGIAFDAPSEPIKVPKKDKL